MNIARRITLALSMGLLMVPITYAQNGGDFSQQKLEKYSEAQQKITNISQQYRGRLNQAQDRDKAIELQQQAQQQMAKAVISAGLTVEEYNRITEAVQSEPQLRERLRKLQ
ncbi:MAG: DUF4168 domain-containing protein [Nitrococcus mobilis]|nr:DUF4168 domain-containing protein [Nitrococcus mobilis]